MKHVFGIVGVLLILLGGGMLVAPHEPIGLLGVIPLIAGIGLVQVWSPKREQE